MSGTRKSEVRRTSAKDQDKDSRPVGGRKRGAAPGDLGRALKTVYDDTLREDVPSDFLDLLGKLE